MIHVVTYNIDYIIHTKHNYNQCDTNTEMHCALLFFYLTSIILILFIGM